MHTTVKLWSLIIVLTNCRPTQSFALRRVIRRSICAVRSSGGWEGAQGAPSWECGGGEPPTKNCFEKSHCRSQSEVRSTAIRRLDVFGVSRRGHGRSLAPEKELVVTPDEHSEASTRRSTPLSDNAE